MKNNLILCCLIYLQKEGKGNGPFSIKLNEISFSWFCLRGRELATGNMPKKETLLVSHLHVLRHQNEENVGSTNKMFYFSEAKSISTAKKIRLSDLLVMITMSF